MTVPYREIITVEPGKRGGKPCIRGMRITVYDVLSYSLRLPDPLAAQLASRARTLGQSKSAVARDLLQDGLAGKNGKRGPSCLDLAGDLVGCLQGPGDLSYNKKHMLGYGQ